MAGRGLANALGIIALLTVLVGLYLAFFYAPRDALQGDVQRLMYIHVPTAWVAFLAFFVVFGASLVYLWKRFGEADRLASGIDARKEELTHGVDPSLGPERGAHTACRPDAEAHRGAPPLDVQHVEGARPAGIDLASFEDWCRQVSARAESAIGLTTMFFPMTRLEKVILDEASGESRSLRQRFEDVVGIPVEDHISL